MSIPARDVSSRTVSYFYSIAGQENAHLSYMFSNVNRTKLLYTVKVIILHKLW